MDMKEKAEKLARQFHETYERLAPKYGYVTAKATRNFDPNSANGKLMIAVCNEIYLNLHEINRELVEALDKAEDRLGYGLSNEETDVFQAMRDAMHIISEALKQAEEL